MDKAGKRFLDLLGPTVLGLLLGGLLGILPLCPANGSGGGHYPSEWLVVDSERPIPQDGPNK